MVVAVSAKVSALQPVACYKLKQRSMNNGDVEIFLGRHGIRIVLPKSNIVIISKEPDWTVFRCNMQTKKYVAVPLAKFSNSFSTSRALVGSPICFDIPLKRVEDTQYLGQPSEQFESGKDFVVRAQALCKGLYATGNYPEYFRLTTLRRTYCPQEVHILCVLQDVPDTGCLPIFARGRGINGRNVTFMETMSIKSISNKDDLFDLPANLTRVSNEASLIGDRQLESLLDLTR
jgi:hypothetical protein